VEQIPIIKVGAFLLVSVQADMHDRLAMSLQDELTAKLVATRAKGVLIDVSSLDMVDSFIGLMLNHMAAMAGVLGAKVVVVGIQPAVAVTIVELGVTLSGVRTALNVDKGIALLQRLVEQESFSDSHVSTKLLEQESFSDSHDCY
jgi:rsbT antagonist protein RsbS